MNTSIKPVEPSDHAAMARLNTDSKIALTINRLLWKRWPNEEAQYQNCLNAIKASSTATSTTTLKIVDDQIGEVLGFLVFERNQAKAETAAKTAEAQDNEPLTVPDQFNPAVFTTVMKSVNAFNKEYARIDHFKIIFTVVRPDSRRRGLGTKLMGVVMERARAQNIPVVTQSEPLAYEFFKSLGFQDTKHVDWDLSQWATPRSGFGWFRLAGLIWYP